MPDLKGPNNPYYGKTHSEEARERMKKSQIGRIEKMKLEGTFESFRDKKRQEIISRLAKGEYKKTSIEVKVENFFKDNNILIKYNFINKYQYDFMILGTQYLVEVQGDYWHANPIKYANKALTERQKYKVNQDKIKKKHAESLGYEIIYIWEYDIRKNDFSSLKGLLKGGEK